MNRKVTLTLLLIFTSVPSFSFQCPEPSLCSLSWGEPPAPWLNNPYSANEPQGEKGTQFVRANILVTSTLGQGVACTYQNSIGLFSIWWPVRTMVPSRQDYRWISTLGGYICNQSIEICSFEAIASS